MTARSGDRDDPVDLSALAAGAELRAARAASGALRRIAAQRSAQAERAALGAAVRRHLARVALPAALVAAASVVVVVASGRVRPRAEDAFARVVLGGDEPFARWVAEDRRPEVAEILDLLEERR